ncbi:hypothetical protein MTO96_000412 [Rhipicephalus appendiculatus]
MRAARNRTFNEIGGGLETTGSTSITTTTIMASTKWSPTTMPTPPLLGHALRPPRPTVSLDARPVLIPILSSVICFPIVALAVICALRYRALRLRRCGGARLEIPGRGGERPSFFSRDSSSGDTSSRPPNNIEEDPRTTGPAASSSSSSSGENYEDELDFARELASNKRKSLAGSGSRRSSRVTFGAAAAILQVPGIPSPLSGSPRSGSPRSASPRASSPRSSLYPRSGSGYKDLADATPEFLWMQTLSQLRASTKGKTGSSRAPVHTLVAEGRWVALVDRQTVSPTQVQGEREAEVFGESDDEGASGQTSEALVVEPAENESAADLLVVSTVECGLTQGDDGDAHPAPSASVALVSGTTPECVSERPSDRDDCVQVAAPTELKKLQLKPRSVPVEAKKDGAAVPKAAKLAPNAPSSIFGGTRPVDTAAREREIEARLARQREEEAR